MDMFNTFFLSRDKIIDREDEQKFIEDEINAPDADLTILYAESGVGKSALTARIATSTKQKKVIRVTTRPENSSNESAEGVYISNIFNIFVRTFQSAKSHYPKSTFEYYLSWNKNAIIRKKALEKMFETIEVDELKKSIGLSISRYMLSRIFKLYEYNTTAILPLRDRDSMLIASDYIKHVLSTTPILLIIDNIQNIDEYSLTLLTDWIAFSNKKSYYIFEYTIINAAELDRLSAFVQHLQDYMIKVKLIKLPYLNPDDALEAIKALQSPNAQKEHFLPAAKDYYIKQSKGNMQKLLDFSLKFHEDYSSRQWFDPTFERIKSISSNMKYILSIIILHNGQIENNYLREIVEYSIDPIILNLNEILNALEYNDLLIENRNGTYYITHAQISDAWNLHSANLRRFELLAQRNCIRHYEKLLDSIFASNERKEAALLFLIKAYAKFKPEELEHLIDLIESIVLERLTPEHAWDYMLTFLDNIINVESDHITSIQKIIKFCFNQNLYKQCLYVLELLAKVPDYSDSDFYLIYKINCIEYLEYHEEAIDLCEKRLKEITEDKKRYYYLLLLMGSYRSLNRKEKYMACVEQIKNIPNYDKVFEYGYFLRLSEIYMSRIEALPYVYQSIQLFSSYGTVIQEIKSGITYAFLLAITQELSKAYYEFSKYEEMAAEYHLFSNIFELNKAGVLLLQKLYGQEIERLLKKAELSTASPFDSLLILTMELINYFESGKIEMAKSLLPRIEMLLEQEADKHLISLVAYDLYHYYYETSHDDLAIKYNKIARETAKYNKTVLCHLNDAPDPLTPNLFNTKWCIGFTFFWNIDYDENF